MRSYLDMTPCERIRYYSGKIRRMTPPRSSRELILVEAFRKLVSENRPLCGDKVVGASDANPFAQGGCAGS